MARLRILVPPTQHTSRLGQAGLVVLGTMYINTSSHQPLALNKTPLRNRSELFAPSTFQFRSAYQPTPLVFLGMHGSRTSHRLARNDRRQQVRSSSQKAPPSPVGHRPTLPMQVASRQPVEKKRKTTTVEPQPQRHPIGRNAPRSCHAQAKRDPRLVSNHSPHIGRRRSMVAPTSGAGAGEEEDGGASMRPPVHGGGGGGGRRGSGTRVRGSWTPEEDDLLRGAVARHGPRNWSVISAESCRLRWCNQLSPGVERRPFTPDEDALIVAAHAQYGNKTTGTPPSAAAAAAAAAAGSAPPALLRHLLTTDPLAINEPAPVASVGVPFEPPMDLKHLDDGDGDEEEEEDDEDEDGSSEDSVLMPPRKKRLCLGIGAAHASPSPLGAAKKPAEHATKPLHQPATTPPEPVTSLTLSLPGGGGGEAPALTHSAAASMDGVARMRAKLEQDWPWLLQVMRQMICEEVTRQMQGANVLVASSAGGRESSNGPD
ncbi:hypothetical protein HU200_024844 [Digitaria exilis]|uniref:Uncharacterized protein n=1 Tax=Digitaria exilis TaxID=1010633 RepID=A0A835C2X4_9POAL|nr:hypothetical protein HU200_024844 [Digitaria exilis]